MNFKNLQAVIDQAIYSFSQQVSLTELPCGNYTIMKYPKLMGIMRFQVNRYAVQNEGYLFAMYTKAIGGLMQLATLVWTPSEGTNVPLLLIDVMAMGKKRAVFVEYYDLTEGHMTYPSLMNVAQRYGTVPDYPEQPAWYVKERAAYSLIKGGSDEEVLLDMLMDSVEAYGEVCKTNTEVYQENRTRLSAFVERMVAEGNPSVGTMHKVLGKDKAEQFFRQLVMPIK